MQIRLGTARAMGYSGSAAGLLDAQTNMTYAVRYLAGAYRAAGGNENRAVALYASGYYYQAKAQGFSPNAAEASSGFGASPGAFQMAENVVDGAPVYRLRHHRHHAVVTDAWSRRLQRRDRAHFDQKLLLHQTVDHEQRVGWIGAAGEQFWEFAGAVGHEFRNVLGVHEIRS